MHKNMKRKILEIIKKSGTTWVALDYIVHRVQYFYKRDETVVLICSELVEDEVIEESFITDCYDDYYVMRHTIYKITEMII